MTGDDKTGKHQDNMDAVIGDDEGDSLHSGAKRLWMRQGDDPAKAGYVSAADLSSEFNLREWPAAVTRPALAPCWNG